MGIQGLLPLLKSIQLPISMAELSGNTVGVDVYCWLHKGAYACALQLAEGKDSDVYVNYVMRRVNMMLYHKVKPILVFDGGYLPSKKEKEVERRNKRRENRTLGMSQLQSGNRTQALEYFQKSIDISPDMAYKVIKACREKDVDCIVAPYEADAQLAYLMKIGITQFTITEDSDLLVYGCEKVIYKMDANGSGLLVNLKNLPKLSVVRMDGFTQEKFRQMCILSGCDYLQSVKGMGLITSHKLLQKHSTVNKLIGTLRLNNKMKVPQDYETRFAQAEQTFLYQIVFDPNTGKFVPLNPVPENINANELHFAGHNGKLSQEQAVQFALGNINPITGDRMGNIEVDKIISFNNQEVSSHEKQKKESTATPKCAQKKGPHTVLSSNGKYEALKNLNGSFRETKSSEKTNTPFLTPMRTKRMRSEYEEKLSEGSKLAKLYFDENDEPSARCHLETDPDDENQKQCQAAMTQPKKRFKNPFRSPVRVVNQSEQIISRYFGLAAMDSINEGPSVLSQNISDPNEDNSTSTKKLHCLPQTTKSLPTEDSITSREHTEREFQDSGHCSQTNECSPHDSSNQPVHKNSTSFSSQMPKPVQAEIELPLRTIADRENQKPLKKKPRSSQTSLDGFAYVKRSTTNDEMKHNVSSKHTVLQSHFSENFKVNAGESNEENEFREDFTKILNNSLDADGEVNEVSNVTLEKHKLKVDNDVQKTRRTIGLRSKPSTGLGRCRSVGLRRPKAGEKRTTCMEIPLLKYFAYQGKSSQGITH